MHVIQRHSGLYVRISRPITRGRTCASDASHRNKMALAVWPNHVHYAGVIPRPTKEGMLSRLRTGWHITCKDQGRASHS